MKKTTLLILCLALVAGPSLAQSKRSSGIAAFQQPAAVFDSQEEEENSEEIDSQRQVVPGSRGEAKGSIQDGQAKDAMQSDPDGKVESKDSSGVESVADQLGPYGVTRNKTEADRENADNSDKSPFGKGGNDKGRRRLSRGDSIYGDRTLFGRQ